MEEVTGAAEGKEAAEEAAELIQEEEEIMEEVEVITEEVNCNRYLEQLMDLDSSTSAITVAIQGNPKYTYAMALKVYKAEVGKSGT